MRRPEFEGSENLLDPNAIARGMNPADPRRAAVAAGREVILRTREYLESRQSFGIETTLSSSSTLATMETAKERGFAVRLVYVCLDDAERNIERVKERVSRGGHDVPDEDVRRRYQRSLQNLPAALRLAHQGVVYDNSLSEPQKVLETREGVITWRSAHEPAWVTGVCQAIASY